MLGGTFVLTEYSAFHLCNSIHCCDEPISWCVILMIWGWKRCQSSVWDSSESLTVSSVFYPVEGRGRHSMSVHHVRTSSTITTRDIHLLWCSLSGQGSCVVWWLSASQWRLLCRARCRCNQMSGSGRFWCSTLLTCDCEDYLAHMWLIRIIPQRKRMGLTHLRFQSVRSSWDRTGSTTPTKKRPYIQPYSTKVSWSWR